MISIAHPPLTHRRKALALTIAGVADFLQIIFFPTFLAGVIADEVIDLIVAVILMAVCGFKWQFVAVFLFELIPGFDLFPTWSAVVLTLPSRPSEEGGGRVSASHTQAGHGPIVVRAVPVPPVQAPPVHSGR